MGHRLIVFFVLSCFVYCSHAEISCYVCTISPSPELNKTTKSCAQFDESEEFEISCQYSTFCLKKTSELVLQNGQIVRVEERGCASQKLTVHKHQPGGWVTENTVAETIYKEGCFPEDQLDLKAAKSEYCYCDSNYCNSGKRATETSFFHHTDAMSVIFIFNVVKFMRSIR